MAVYGKLVDKNNFSVLLGVEYLKSSILVKDARVTKYSELENGVYRFNFLSFPLLVRHGFFYKKFFFEYGLKFYYDVGSTHEFLNERKRLDLFVLPSVQFGLGSKISFRERNILLLLGTNLSTKVRGSYNNDYVLRYNTICFSVAYAL